MHKVAMEMGKWAMEKAKTHGFDNLSAQDWDDLKDCMEAVKCAICADKDYRIVEAMDECEQEEKYLGRMGYDRYRYSNGRFAPKGRGSRSDMRMDGMNHKQSRYGESYDRYSENRRHYHDSKDSDSKRKMDDSMKEYTSDIVRNLTEMWSDADATLRQSMKTDLTRLIQQMN